MLDFCRFEINLVFNWNLLFVDQKSIHTHVGQNENVYDARIERKKICYIEQLMIHDSIRSFDNRLSTTWFYVRFSRNMLYI